MAIRFRVCMALLGALCLLASSPSRADVLEEELYVENSWGVAEDSLDVSALPSPLYGKLKQVVEAGVLRVSMEPYYAPQEFIDPSLEGQASFVGSDVELAKRIAERMGVELEIVPMEFTKVLEAVKDGTVDLAISALSYTPGRASSVLFSKGYHSSAEEAGSCLIIRAEDEGVICGVEDLVGRDIVAQSGSLQELLLAERVPSYHQYVRVPSVMDVYAFLRSGKADASMGDIQVTQSYIEHNPDCGLLALTDTPFVLHPEFDGDRVAAKKGALQLMAFVNGVIDEVLEEDLYEKWFEEYDLYAKRLGY
ncbi:MAG: transporter substrate-binding domain-containing protein [Blautia sp.]|nr:transporter substrate-binding domain-containing protein [Blautia sp.]